MTPANRAFRRGLRDPPDFAFGHDDRRTNDLGEQT